MSTSGRSAPDWYRYFGRRPAGAGAVDDVTWQELDGERVLQVLLADASLIARQVAVDAVRRGDPGAVRTSVLGAMRWLDALPDAGEAVRKMLLPVRAHETDVARALFVESLTPVSRGWRALG